VLGALAWRIGLPPLVGFLIAGFVFSAFGGQPTETLNEIADAGVLLLLFAVGLKLRFKTLVRPEVWGSATAHIVFVGVVVAGALFAVTELSGSAVAVVAIALSFSSTVLAAKVLDSQFELRAVHGRVAIGILIVQDLVAVAVLAIVSARSPSPYALGIVLLPLTRPLAYRLLDFVGHGELLVLFGAVVAIVAGGSGFTWLGLSPELGALLLGILFAGHKRAEELSSAIWGLKEILLVGFFLNVGLGGLPNVDAIERAAWILALLPAKASVLFLLLLAFGLRARTSFLTSISLATYSEFAIIVANGAVSVGLLAEDWLVVFALAVAVSFAVAAPLNSRAHDIYEKLAPWLDRLERDRRHPDDEPVTLGSADILVVGMGRLGTGAYDYLHAQGRAVVGGDSDPGKLERHISEGRRVVYIDAEDPSFWRLLKFERLHAIMLAFPDMRAKRIAGIELRKRGYRGLLSATHVFPEEQAPILASGIDATYNYFTEAGVGFARDTAEALDKPLAVPTTSKPG
jgi:predicted Kef-type K+ transport protein